MMEKSACDEYDPFDQRPESQKNTSSFATFIHLLKMAVGTGILLLPYAFKQAGYGSAIICGIFIGVVATHTAVILIETNHKLCRRMRVPSLTFSETAENAFKLGPKSLRFLGPLVGFLANFIVCLIQYQTTVVFALYAGGIFQQLVSQVFHKNYDLNVYLLSLLPIFMLMALAPNFKYLAPLSIISFAFLGVGVFSAGFYFSSNFEDPSRLPGITSYQAIPAYCAVFLFAVHNTAVLVPLENAMKNPRHMSKVVTASMSLSVLIYIIFGFFGYNKYMEACDTVIKNLPDEMFSYVIRLVVALSVVFGYGLQFYVPATIIWPIFASVFHVKGKFAESLFRLGLVCLSTLQAIALPQMMPLLGLLSAVSMTTVMFLIPISMESVVVYSESGKSRRQLTYLKNALIFVLYLVILVVASIDNIKDIIKKFTPGYEEESGICGPNQSGNSSHSFLSDMTGGWM